MGLTAAALILTHAMAILGGFLAGMMVNQQAMRENPAAFRLVLAAVVMLTLVAAAIALIHAR